MRAWYETDYGLTVESVTTLSNFMHVVGWKELCSFRYDLISRLVTSIVLFYPSFLRVTVTAHPREL
jgi:hypothetical protein